MNLIERYLSKPGNYIVEAGGGYGKSTSLKYLAGFLKDRQVNGKKELAVYIPMAEFNFRNIQAGALLEYLRQFFSMEVTERAILEMIADSAEEYHYLFLLDGLNEVHNYEVNGQTVMDHICNDIMRLISYANVSFIISTRSAELIPENLKKEFEILVLQPLSNQAVSRYLGIKDMEMIPGHIRKMLENPMLLTIFRDIYEKMPEQAVKIGNKYELFELYFVQDENLHHHEEYSDHLLRVRKYVIEKILPAAAFEAECRLLKNEQNSEKDMQEILKKTCDTCSPPEHTSAGMLREAVFSLGILDRNRRFTHELYRDYFAAKGFEQLNGSDAGDRTADFIELLNGWIEHNGRQKELARRTRFLDLADFIFSAVGSGLVRKLRSCGVRSEERILTLAENFYQQLSGVYDDLSEGREAAEIGWIALKHLQEAEQYYHPVEAAQKYSFTYYSIKWDITGDLQKDGKCLEVILNARKILDQVQDDWRDQEYHRLYGKVLSNIGSYYYKLGQKKGACALEMYETAERFHRQALEYRKKYCDDSALAASYRTLMSDSYQMGNYVQGYRYYCEAMDALNQNRTLEEALVFQKGGIPEDLVERAIGSEVKILMEGNEPELRARIQAELPNQIRYVYERSAQLNRSYLKMIRSLEEKLDELAECETVREKPGLLNRIMEYKKKCSSFR